MGGNEWVEQQATIAFLRYSDFAQSPATSWPVLLFPVPQPFLPCTIAILWTTSYSLACLILSGKQREQGAGSQLNIPQTLQLHASDKGNTIFTSQHHRHLSIHSRGLLTESLMAAEWMAGSLLAASISSRSISAPGEFIVGTSPQQFEYWVWIQSWKRLTICTGWECPQCQLEEHTLALEGCYGCKNCSNLL